MSRGLRLLAAVAVVFGVATVSSGGRALFGDAGASLPAGRAEPTLEPAESRREQR
jgi:hypothetical protein